MAIAFDIEAANAVFTLPRADGTFDEEFRTYLHKLGQKRRSVLFAFPPKAAGTFIRSAAVEAVDGQLSRVVHAYGGRDGTPYLPAYILYLAGGFPAATMVTHIHMQALPANRHFVEALDLKPIIMVRSVPDMLLSYIDMLNNDAITPDRWLNLLIPPTFSQLSDEEQADFVIDTIGPWYASYYATWFDYAAQMPDRVCVLHFQEFKRDPIAVLESALRHSGLERSRRECEEALDVAWHERGLFRFNKGEQGRGAAHFNTDQMARLEKLLLRHYSLSNFREELFPQS